MFNETGRIKIALLTATVPQDRRPWSGTTYFVGQALQKHCGEVTYIGPLPPHKANLGERLLGRGSKLLLKKRYYYERGISAAKWYGKFATQKVDGQDFDVIVVAEGSNATTIISFLETYIPVVYMNDVTFTLLYDYYQYLSNPLGLSVRDLSTVETLTLKKASAVIYSSTWAARSAIEDYGADPAKIHVVPFGANIDEPPSREVVLAREKSECCRLLFLGVDWIRKGGDLAFETLLKLEELGVQAELIVCGCTPPQRVAHERMTVMPFLDKNDERQRKELDQLLMSADFLLLPTRADCTPIVFCEASAFGLPVITTHTGGVPEIVRDGENGFLLPYEARGDAYAEVIARVYHDDERYAALVRASRAAFEECLNWDAWGLAVKHILSNMLAHKNSYEDLPRKPQIPRVKIS